MPPDALYMLQSIRVFGQFEKPVFLKLCKHTEIMNVPAGSFLFKIGNRFGFTKRNSFSKILFVGDADENVYVVQSGKLNVFITNSDGSTLSLKIVKTGESVTSLLSFTDVLTVSFIVLLNSVIKQKYLRVTQVHTKQYQLKRLKTQQLLNYQCSLSNRYSKNIPTFSSE